MTRDSFDLPNGVERSESLHRSAEEVFPGGVSHNIRYFEPHPIYIDGTDGGRFRDVDGNEYVDFWMNHITSVLGHSHPSVVKAVRRQVERGLHYGAPNEMALELGQAIQERVASAERIRFCASGTEATMYAVRLARAHTDSPHVLKAEGGWHGGNTSLTAAIHDPFEVPASSGLVPGAGEHVHAFPVNDRDAVLELLDAHDVGGVIIEPMLLAGGGIEADIEFLEFLRDEADDRGFVLIFDEVVTGFRFSPGSYQDRVDVIPDVTTLGKFLGGGLPVGAVAGRTDLFEAARPDYDGDDALLVGGGTFSMNPMTATAGLESFNVLDYEPVYEYTERQGEKIRDELAATFERLGIDATVLGSSSLFIPHFAPEGPLETVRDVETRTNRDALKAFHRRLIERGYYFLPAHMGAVSYQTEEEDIDRFLDAVETVGQELVADGYL